MTTENPFLPEYASIREDDRADFIEDMIDALVTIVNVDAHEIRPHTVRLAAQFFCAASETVDEPEYAFQPFESWNTETFADALPSLPCFTSSGKDFKTTAVAVSEKLTPEQAQKLYHFAVLVTKLV